MNARYRHTKEVNTDSTVEVVVDVPDLRRKLKAADTHCDWGSSEALQGRWKTDKNQFDNFQRPGANTPAFADPEALGRHVVRGVDEGSDTRHA